MEHGACILATTLSDHETAAEKCEQDEEGYDGCSQYLYSKSLVYIFFPCFFLSFVLITEILKVTISSKKSLVY